MALDTAIAATQAEATSSAISLNGPIEIRAFGLGEGENVVVQWEKLDGTFEQAKGGAGSIVLTRLHPSTIYIGYSDIKVKKTTSIGNVSVGYALAS